MLTPHRTTATWVVALMLVLLRTAPAQARVIGTDLEVIVGADTAAALEQRYGVHKDAESQQRIEKLGKQMIAVSGRTALNYHFAILNVKEINALAVPGGWVYVTKGLMDRKLTDDELAFVLGHEVAHIARRHGVSQLEKSLGISLGLGLILDRSATTQALVSDILQLLLQSGYSREDEYDADKNAVTYALASGYKPEGGVTFLTRLQALSKHEPSSLERWFATHPPMPQRIARLEEEIAVAEKGRRQ
jgi:predicted Zn-dependent protease